MAVAMSKQRPGPYQLQAAISALHARAQTAHIPRAEFHLALGVAFAQGVGHVRADDLGRFRGRCQTCQRV